MMVGYLRSDDPSTIVNASRRMEEAGCARTLIDAAETAAPRSMSEPLKALVSTLNADDTLTVFRLNHLAPMPELLTVLVRLAEAGIVVSSLEDGFSTADKQVRAALTTLGRYSTAPHSESKGKGRTRALNDQALERARQMIEGQGMNIVDVASAMNVSRATIYRHLGSERSMRRKTPAQHVPERYSEAV